MKRCPTCRSTYTDDSLRFCLQDGATLLSVSDAPSSSFDTDVTLRDQSLERLGHDPPATEILDARALPTMRVQTPAPTEDIRSRATDYPRQNISPAPKSSNPAMTVALMGVAALLVLGAGLGLMLWLRRSPASGNNTTATGESNRQQAATNENKAVAASADGDGNRGAAPNRITATASSTRPPLAGNTYEAGKVLDGRLMTAWVEGVDGPGIGEWIRCDFEREVSLQRVSIAPGYFKSPQIWARNNRVAAATFYFSDGGSREFRFPDRMEEQLLELGAVKTSWVRIVIKEVYAGADPDTAISQLAFEWER